MTITINLNNSHTKLLTDKTMYPLGHFELYQKLKYIN